MARWQPGPEQLQFLNVRKGLDLTIRELADAVAKATGLQGEIHWDTSKPDGTPRKYLDVSRLAAVSWRKLTSLREGFENKVALFHDKISEKLAILKFESNSQREARTSL